MRESERREWMKVITVVVATFQGEKVPQASSSLSIYILCKLIRSFNEKLVRKQGGWFHPKIQTKGGDCNNNYNSDCKEELDY